MAAQSLGTLTIDLQAKTATLQSDLGKAARLTEQQLAAMQANAVATGLVIGEAISAGLQKIPELVTRALDQFDEFSKASQKVGVTTDEFSKLAYAAGLSDVSVEDLTSTLGKLDKNQVAAASGNKQMADNFDALGISVKNADGSLKSPVAVLGQLADLFHNLPDGAGKTAIAIALLGKSGANAIPLLNGGSAALKDLGDEATAFGATVDGPTGKAAEDFNDNLTRLKTASEGFGNQLTKDLLPSLVNFSQQLVDDAKQTGSLQSAADGVATALKGFATFTVIVVAGVRDMVDVVAASVDTLLLFGKTVLDITDPKLLTDKAARDTALNDMATFGQKLSAIGANVTDSFQKNQETLASSMQAIWSPKNLPKTEAAGPTDADQKAALAAQQAFLDATAKQKAADEAAAAAKKALAAQLREQTSLEQREIAVKNVMAAGVEKATDQLYKSDIPGLDEYNKSLQETNKQVAQFTQQDTNKITHAISPADVKAISDYKDQMTQLATATLAAARAKNDLDQQDQTASFEAQAADSKAATAGVAGLAEENYNYAKSLQAAALAFENNTASDATDLYTRQVAALGTLHDAAVKNINDQYDQGVIATKSIAGGLGDELAAQIDGTAAHEGFKGFIDDFEAMITQASAKAIAANLIQKLLGNASQTGQVGGWLGSLFDTGVGSNTSSAADAVRAQEASVTGSGSSSSWLSLLGSLFGGGKAIGGAVSPNKGYLVGENGPEFFSPSTSGMIIPNGGLAGAGGPSVRNTFFLAAPTSARTQNQIANRTQFDLNRASRLR